MNMLEINSQTVPSKNLKTLRTSKRRFPSHGISAGKDGLVISLCGISRFLVFGIPNAASRPFAPRQRRESSPTQKSKDGDLISRRWRSLVLSTIRSASFHAHWINDPRSHVRPFDYLRVLGDTLRVRANLRAGKYRL